MYKTGNGIVYSPSDLMVHMKSSFSSWMSWMSWLAVDYPERLAGIEKGHDEMMGLLANKGIEHDTTFLDYLIEQYGVWIEALKVINMKVKQKSTLRVKRAAWDFSPENQNEPP